ncbi:hypothetical protein CALVIDRAFT_322950 [Calocera viscosa TUFC12733]|uniref:Uncharacterized protein n=1 Tax=Calocera viscosa (strain TUFC12733) TaxID=1330018 RepID=A0A167QQ50_CALVF|nr:hypothetical protein CALVIDRAFT_322950 [Calocera viscosa TUFC12733]
MTTGRWPFNAALCKAVCNDVSPSFQIGSRHTPLPPYLRSLPWLHTLQSLKRQLSNYVSEGIAANGSSRHRTTSSLPRLAAACKAVRPVLGAASFAKAKREKLSFPPASYAAAHSCCKVVKSPEAADAARDSSRAVEGFADGPDGPDGADGKSVECSGSLPLGSAALMHSSGASSKCSTSRGASSTGSSSGGLGYTNSSSESSSSSSGGSGADRGPASGAPG